MSSELIELVQRLGQPRVLVIGDVMLDRYVWGDAERISQEAPVILLRADRREERDDLQFQLDVIRRRAVVFGLRVENVEIQLREVARDGTGIALTPTRMVE